MHDHHMTLLFSVQEVSGKQMQMRSSTCISSRQVHRCYGGGSKTICNKEMPFIIFINSMFIYTYYIHSILNVVIIDILNSIYIL